MKRNTTAEMAGGLTAVSHNSKPLRKRIQKQLPLQIFVWLGIAFLVVFSYTPMVGIIIAFKQYKIASGITGMFTSDWAGLRYFREMLNDYNFPRLVRNTLQLSILKLIFCFPVPILLAVMLSEVRNMVVKRIVQTLSYLPHFISWVIVMVISYAFFSSETGLVSKTLLSLNLIDEPLRILTDPNSFMALAVSTAVWKEAGWWTIIFLASIAGIDPGLYEAAEIDGAGRLKRIWHITLPGMKGSIIVLMILSIGSILGGGLGGSNFEQSLLLGNSLNSEKSMILQSYAFNIGLAEGRFAFATAIDLVQSVIAVTLMMSSNALAKRLSGTSLF